ncbi:MAG: Uma2 family endonuclease [Armatimonadetes bacterium]|nr:Uma2 family endonuclease [Armatimonadota bacterium]
MEVKEANAITTYLVQERQSEYKSERIRGAVVRMADRDDDHHDIKANLICALQKLCSASEYRVLTQMRVLCPRGDIYYPDLVITRRGHSLHFDEERDCLQNPVCVIEIATRGTIMMDGIIKRQRYIAMPSLELYMLVHAPEEASGDGRMVTTYIRVYNETYFRLGLTYPGGRTELPFPAASVTFMDIFENTQRLAINEQGGK